LPTATGLPQPCAGSLENLEIERAKAVRIANQLDGDGRPVMLKSSRPAVYPSLRGLLMRRVCVRFLVLLMISASWRIAAQAPPPGTNGTGRFPTPR